MSSLNDYITRLECDLEAANTANEHLRQQSTDDANTINALRETIERLTKERDRSAGDYSNAIRTSAHLREVIEQANDGLKDKEELGGKLLAQLTAERDEWKRRAALIPAASRLKQLEDNERESAIIRDSLRTQLADAIRERDDIKHQMMTELRAGTLGPLFDERDTLRADLAKVTTERDANLVAYRESYAKSDAGKNDLAETIRALRTNLAKATADRDTHIKITRLAAEQLDSLRLLIETKDKALRVCHPANIWDRARMYYQGPGPDTITRDWHNERCEQVNAALALTPDSLTEELRSLREDKEIWRSIDDLPPISEDDDEDRCVVVWQSATHIQDQGVDLASLAQIRDGDFRGPEYLNTVWRSLMDAPPLRDAIRNAKEGTPSPPPL